MSRTIEVSGNNVSCDKHVRGMIIRLIGSRGEWKCHLRQPLHTLICPVLNSKAKSALLA